MYGFSNGKIPRAQTPTGAFSPSDREARNITSRARGIPRLAREIPSPFRCRAYFATCHGRTYLLPRSTTMLTIYSVTRARTRGKRAFGRSGSASTVQLDLSNYRYATHTYTLERVGRRLPRRQSVSMDALHSHD